MASNRGRQSKWDIPNDNSSPNPVSASDAARERAARINAMLAAKGKLAKGAPPPLISPSFSAPALSKPTVISQASQELFSDEVEINDSPSRVILCKGTTQDEINRYSGAAVSTKGRYMSKDDIAKAKANGTNERPLYLSVQGTSQDKVNMAVQRVKEIMNGADIRGNPPSRQAPPVSSSRQQPHAPPQYNNILHTPPPPEVQQQPQPGPHYLQEKLFVGLDHAPSEFNLNDKLLGPAGCYFQHIATQTGAKVLLRGRGSGFIEPTSGREAFETMYIFITHPRPDGVQAAKSLVQNLLQTVHNDFQSFDQMRKSYSSGQWCSYNQPPTTQQAGAGYPPRYTEPNDQAGYGYDSGPPGPRGPLPRGFGPPPNVPPHFFNHHQPQGPQVPQGPRGPHPPYPGGPMPFHPPGGQPPHPGQLPHPGQSLHPGQPPHPQSGGQPPHPQPGGQPLHSQPGGQPPHPQPRGQPPHSQPGGQPPHSQPGGQPSHSQPGGQPPLPLLGGQPPHCQPRGQPPHSQPGGQPPLPPIGGQPPLPPPGGQPPLPPPGGQPLLPQPPLPPTGPPGPDFHGAHPYSINPPGAPPPDQHMYLHPGQPPLPPPQNVPYSPSQPNPTNIAMPQISEPHQHSPMQTAHRHGSQSSPVQTTPSRPEPPKRRFREQAVSRSAAIDDSSSFLHQHHSSTHNSDLGPYKSMLPPPLPPMDRFDERPMAPPPPPEENMPPPPPPAAPVPVSFKVPKRSRLQPSPAEHQKEAKRVKKEEPPVPSSGGIASLVAYGEGDSSDEEDESNYVTMPAKKGGTGKGVTRTGKGNKPFWAVR